MAQRVMKYGCTAFFLLFLAPIAFLAGFKDIATVLFVVGLFVPVSALIVALVLDVWGVS